MAFGTFPGVASSSRSRSARYARKRAKRIARVDNDLTDEQWTALVDAWGGCAYCAAADVPLQRDCVLAISRGGRYTLLNVVPACGSCNASKCNDEVTSWLRRKRLDERAFLVRHHEISRALAQRFVGGDATDATDATDSTDSTDAAAATE